MRKTLSTYIFFVFLMIAASVQAQEFNIKVELNTSTISRTGIEHINALSRQIEEYINSYKWSQINYLQHEQLNAVMQINLTDVTDNLTFTGSVVIQLNRPIYNTVQLTPVLTLVDNNWSFSYPQNRVFIHDDFQFDEIASFLDFYAFVMLGYDADTFAPLGGAPYFNKANGVYDIAGTSNSSGWSRSTKQGRALLIQTITTPAYEKMRMAFYQYHRKGLDLFTQNPEKARENILQALEQLEENQKSVTDLYLFDVFFNAKYRELVSIFSDAEPSVKQKVYLLLTKIDPSHISKYDELQ